jgi:predicted DNA-binding WGR domain protein
LCSARSFDLTLQKGSSFHCRASPFYGSSVIRARGLRGRLQEIREAKFGRFVTTVGELVRRCHGLPISKLNRSGSSDSKVSLDVEIHPYDSSSMIIQPYNVYIERTDKAENKARFYAMSIEPTLFGEASLLRRWGRIGSTGQQKIHRFEDKTSCGAVARNRSAEMR